MKSLSGNSIFVLLNHKTSRPNKLALCAEYACRGFFLEWRWKGAPMRSRFEIRTSPEDRFFECKSYEEDVAPLLDERTKGRP